MLQNYKSIVDTYLLYGLIYVKIALLFDWESLLRFALINTYC